MQSYTRAMYMCNLQTAWDDNGGARRRIKGELRKQRPLSGAINCRGMTDELVELLRVPLTLEWPNVTSRNDWNRPLRDPIWWGSKMDAVQYFSRARCREFRRNFPRLLTRRLCSRRRRCLRPADRSLSFPSCWSSSSSWEHERKSRHYVYRKVLQ